MTRAEFYKKMYLLIQPLFYTFIIVMIISCLWMHLEEVYLGYINDNPVDSVITIIYSLFVYLWAKDRCKKELEE